MCWDSFVISQRLFVTNLESFELDVNFKGNPYRALKPYPIHEDIKVTQLDAFAVGSNLLIRFSALD